MDQLVLKRASASRSSGEWRDDDHYVVAGGIVVGRIFNAAARCANGDILRCGKRSSLFAVVPQ
jgi:hypothetical protein